MFLAVWSRCNVDPSGNERGMFRLYRFDGSRKSLADVWTYHGTNNGRYVLESAGIPVVEEQGTLAPGELRYWDGWRERNAKLLGDDRPAHRTQYATVARSDASGASWEAVRIAADPYRAEKRARIFRPDVPERVDRVARPAWRDIAHA